MVGSDEKQTNAKTTQHNKQTNTQKQHRGECMMWKCVGMMITVADLLLHIILSPDECENQELHRKGWLHSNTLCVIAEWGAYILAVLDPQVKPNQKESQTQSQYHHRHKPPLYSTDTTASLKYWRSVASLLKSRQKLYLTQPRVNHFSQSITFRSFFHTDLKRTELP